MSNLLREGERLDDLQRSNLQIIQNPAKFCFGMDAVLLSGFVTVKKGENVLDLGTGTGIIPILLSAKTQGSHFTGLEIQEEMAEMADRSVRLNKITDRVEICQGDLKKASAIFGASSFDVVTCNPPYMNQNHGLKNPGRCQGDRTARSAVYSGGRHPGERPLPEAGRTLRHGTSSTSTGGDDAPYGGLRLGTEAHPDGSPLRGIRGKHGVAGSFSWR